MFYVQVELDELDEDDVVDLPVVVEQVDVLEFLDELFGIDFEQ